MVIPLRKDVRTCLENVRQDRQAQDNKNENNILRTLPSCPLSDYIYCSHFHLSSTLTWSYTGSHVPYTMQFNLTSG